MKGILIVNGFLMTDRFKILYDLLVEAFNNQGIPLLLKTNDEIITSIQDKFDLDCDFIIFWDKDIVLGERLEKAGYKLFNSIESIKNCDDKVLTCLKLKEHNLPIPETIIAPFTFENIPYNRFEFIDKVINKLGLPLIIKENKGSFGAQVYLANTKDEVFNIIDKTKTKPIHFQKFISSSKSRDVRVEVVGGKALGAVMRCNPNDFRSNVLAGGSMIKFEAPSEFIDIAEKASIALGLDFGGIDIMFGPNGEPIICEVNSNCHFNTFYKTTGINLAEEICKYIIKELNDLH